MIWYYFLLSLFLFVCCASPPEKPDKGVLTDHVYTNAYFDFSIEIPEGWVIHSEEEREKLSDAGKENLRESNPEMAAKIDSAEQDVLQLLSVFKFKVDATSEQFNPSLIIMSERLPDDLHDIKEQAYLGITKQQLQQTGLYQTYELQNMPVNIGGEDFALLRVSSKQRDVVTQEFFARVVNERYALIVILSYINADQRKELHTLLENFSFD
jgi:hypothetical protein